MQDAESVRAAADALLAARAARDRADDESIWWQRVACKEGDAVRTHVLRPDDSWTVYRVANGEALEMGSGGQA